MNITLPNGKIIKVAGSNLSALKPHRLGEMIGKGMNRIKNVTDKTYGTYGGAALRTGLEALPMAVGGAGGVRVGARVAKSGTKAGISAAKAGVSAAKKYITTTPAKQIALTTGKRLATGYAIRAGGTATGKGVAVAATMRRPKDVGQYYMGKVLKKIDYFKGYIPIARNVAKGNYAQAGKGYVKQKYFNPLKGMKSKYYNIPKDYWSKKL